MGEPILALQDTWFTKGNSGVLRSSITEIEIKDTYIPTGSETAFWDASEANDGSVMVYVEGAKLIIAGNGSGKVYANPDSTAAFSSTGSDYFSSLTTFIGGNLLNTSKATTMKDMFRLATKLTTVDVSNWDTSNVTSLYRTFSGKSGSEMALQTLDVSNWNTGKVTDMIATFQRCTNLRSLNVGNWNTSNISSFQNAFSWCYSLTELNVSGWNTESCTTMTTMFGECRSLEELNVSNWNTSACTDMSYMFAYCYSLKELNVSNWDVSKVTDFRNMFAGTDYGEQHMQVTEIDVSSWDTSSASNMGWMFYGNPQLKTLDVSKWDVSKVTNFHHMFAWCTGLEIKGLENWNPKSAIHTNAMFHSNQTSNYDLSNWDVSNVENFGQMFERNTRVTEIKGLEKWNTSKGKTFNEMFYGCTNLKVLDLSSFDTRAAQDGWIDEIRNLSLPGMQSMFGLNSTETSHDYGGLCRLEKITLGPNFSFNGNGSCNRTTLPNQTGAYVPGADGNWYTRHREAYAPADVPSNKAATYYATLDMVNDLEYLIKNGSMLDIADAIRAKANITDYLNVQEMIGAIDGIVGVNDLIDAEEVEF